MIRHILKLLAIAQLAFFLFSGEALANRTVTSVTLNGVGSVTVLPGATISTKVTVNTTDSGGADWTCTAWRILPAGWVKVTHTQHKDPGTYSETFNITAPSLGGTYSVDLIAYSNDKCDADQSPTFTLSNSVTVVVAPSVTSISRVNPSPTTLTSVSWTVTFSQSVTGVDASDFALIQSGITGAAITSVTGSGTTWTVTASTGTGGGTLGLNLVDNDSIVGSDGITKLGGTGLGNGNFTGEVYSIFSCSPPPGSPGGLTCVCDTFGRSSGLNPSTIFGGNWIVSTSDDTGVLPRIVTPGYLRLTDNTNKNAKAVTVPGVFPAKGNYISVEFQHFAYSGSGADGMAVILSDYSVPAVPGAFGGSLGYAQKSNPGSDCTKTGGCPGFAGGWIGVGLDEFGNYQSASEGRLGGPGFLADSVAVRGSGSGLSGYRWLAGTNALTPTVDNPGSTSPAPGAYYQVIVDARNDPTSTSVAVNRDSSGTGTYSSLFNLPNVYSAAQSQGFTQAAVPTYWQVSFTGSTGSNVNIHEISGLRICALNILPLTGGVANNFNAIDAAYGTPPLAVQNYLTGHIYTKLVGVPFSLSVAAIKNSQLENNYVISGTKPVTVKLVDNSDGACVIDNAKPNYCSSACTGKTAVAGGSQTISFAQTDQGQKQSANFTLNSAYQNLVAIMSDGKATACSTDTFAVRPLGIGSVASVETPSGVGNSASNTGTSGKPTFKAGSGQFALTATINGIAGNLSGYNGVPTIGNAGVQALAPAVVPGSVAGTFAAATPGIPSSSATGTTFTYSEVGAFRLLGYDPANDTTSARGVFDGSWTIVDSVDTRSDCVPGNYSNSLNGDGKYGCNFGLMASADFGRFIPDHFTLSTPSLANRKGTTNGSNSIFTYMDEPMAVQFTLTAQNATGGTTKNYTDSLAKLNLATPASFGFAAFNNGSTKTPLSSRLTASDSSGDWPNDAAHAYAGNGVASVSATLTLGRGTSPDGPYEALDIGAAPLDSDGVTLLSTALDRDMDNNGSNDHQLVGSTRSRFGRLRLGNGYGPAVLPLRLPLSLQYWNGNTFATNYDDSQTSLLSGKFSLGNFQKNLQSGETCLRLDGVVLAGACPSTSVIFNRGQGTVVLTAPGANNDGSVDVGINLGFVNPTDPGLPYLQGNWIGSTYNGNPSARANFGLYQRNREIIYMRENF